MKRLVDFLTDLSLGGATAIGFIFLSTWLSWELLVSWLHRRHQRAMAQRYQRRMRFFAWMEKVRREMAARGHAEMPLPAIDCDWHLQRETENFRWELFFENGRSPREVVDAWEKERAIGAAQKS